MNNRKVIIFAGPYTEDKYNQFFNPNVCHVCKNPSRYLITCNLCNLISYCSEEHKEIHRILHSEFCIAVARIITEKSFSDTYPSLEHWIASRDDILQRIQPNLSRYVYQYEKEMILCAKTCYVCYRQINVSPCNICYSANFCNDHQILCSVWKGHGKECVELLVLLNMNISDIINDKIETWINQNRKFSKFPYSKDFHDNITFINSYVLSRDPYTHRKMLDDPNSTLAWTFEQYVYSDAISNPLTLFYALKESNILYDTMKTDKYIVHLIDANRKDVISLQTWHIFLHFSRRIKELHIVLIKSPIFESRDLGSVCSTCRTYGQKLYVKNVSETYYTYVRSESYEPPNVIILQTRISSMGTWLGSITAIIAQRRPLLLTADTEMTVKGNINKIEEVTGETKKRLYRKNKFRGCRPYRNYVTGGCCYRNAYFIMYF
ncbi:uncharacterized protein LOC116850727 [Odontomachus brunneus]|uniref:uncharacterized protein LOC116850727 n=1 Tax=Odontomachus brunneus TaxID=486640 RepID=UPI0013F1C529|nr:uncharacterized protein LOC116850725 isoform X1 [Odontomachus brunneus]XP_032685228.1 uncharacterized protein LOC116850725 isoform X1 [Odontomachus brunneus]XP_032685229.1 uncharacterized protein LOC116850727 [Odontomachus brunneus]XP_032685230.1 uncharacterized protein LOC116850727 [Odontomachus brunneus]